MLKCHVLCLVVIHMREKRRINTLPLGKSTSSGACPQWVQTCQLVSQASLSVKHIDNPKTNDLFVCEGSTPRRLPPSLIGSRSVQ